MQRSPTCPKCLKNYEFKDFRPIGSHIPLLLSCGHGFCEGCLLKLARKQVEVNCPTCEVATTLDPSGERGVKNFLPDIYLLGILTYNKRVALECGQNRFVSGPTWNFGNIYHLSPNNLSKEKKPENNEENKDKENTYEENRENEEKDPETEEAKHDNEHKCEECNQPATCICKSCDNCLFCQNCFDQYHKALKRLQKHQPMPLCFPTKSDLECAEHGGRALEFFDKDLDESVCALCIIADKCKGHEIVPIGELDECLKAELENSIASAKQAFSMLKVSEKVIANVLPEISMIANQFCQDVRDHFNGMHTNLQMREAKILTDASQKFAQNANLGGLISECIQKQKLIQSVMNEFEFMNQNPQVLRLRVKELLSKLEKFKDMECFAKRMEGNSEDLKITVDKDLVDGLKTIGELEITDNKLVRMMKLHEVTDEEINLAKLSTDNDVAETSDVQENEILNGDHKPTYKHRCYESAMLRQINASYELVHVTYVKSPEQFYVQRCADKERLQIMMQSLNKYCRNTDKQEDLVFFVEKDDLVCAQFLADNNWYRARVISARSKQQPDVVPTWENGLPVEVHYLDYGNTESLPLARLRKMKPHLLEVPEIAVPCSLMDIVPPARKEKWPLNSIKAFNSLVGEKQMLLNIRARFDGKLYVDLKSPEDDEPTQDDERPISVRDALVFLEVAKFISPESIAPEQKQRRVFKEPQLPDVGQIIDVLVTHVISPHEIYVQKFDSPIVEVHNELANLYSGKKNGGLKIPFPYRNLVCAARFSEDKMWYRGEVTHVHDNATVDVAFIDYGNSETTSFSEIKKLPDRFLTLRKQAMPVKLKDVAPVGGSEQWSKEAKNFLSVAVLNKPMVMIVKENENGMLAVELCDTSTDDDIYINHLMVQKKHAISTGPSSEDKLLGPSQKSSNQSEAESSYGLEAGTDNGVSDNDQAKTWADIMDPEVEVQETSYRKPNFPRRNMFHVMGTFIDIHGFVFGHIVEEESEVLQKISQKLNDGEMASLPGLENTNTLRVNQPIVAQFTDGIWYRASITRIVDAQHVEAEFIDFGNTDIVNASQVRTECPFLDVPKQAVKLRLHGIEPVRPDGTYPSEAHGTLSNIMVNKRFAVTMEGLQTDPSVFNVSIRVSSGEDLAEGLVKAGLARRTQTEAPSTGNEDHSSLDQRIQHQISLPATADFIQPTLPQIGVHFDVSVTQVSRPNMVFIQRLPPFDGEECYSKDEDDTEEIAKEQIEDLRRMTTMINSPEFFDDTFVLDRLNAGMACCAMYSEDEQWYRAKVISVSTNQTQQGTAISAEVLFVDYGTSEIVPIQRIRRIPEDFLELPVQGICCELAGTYPPQGSEGPFFRDTNWPIETMKNLYGLVANKRMIASIMDYGPPVRILLFDRQTTDEGETGEVCDLSVGKLLADAKLAVFNLSEDSNSNSTGTEI